MIRAVATVAAWSGRALVNAVLPPRCLVCRSGVDAQGALCIDCWSDLDFIAGPVCATCGLPFAFEFGPGAICAACAARPPKFDRARAALVYGDTSRDLILGLKHGDRTEVAPTLARWVARAGAELIADADLIAPVPLHRFRLLARRHNQAALIAAALPGARTKLAPDLLVRRRRTPSQGGLSARERRRNVAGAFAVRPAWRAKVAGKRILLIDDVHTTGATIEACARVLRRAGARAVDALTVARVVRPTDSLI
jgi:ComF family protein